MKIISSSSKVLITDSIILSRVSQGLIKTKSNCNKSIRNETFSNNSFREIVISVIVLFQNSGLASLFIERAVKY